MTETELLVLKYKAAAFDALVAEIGVNLKHVGIRHIPIKSGCRLQDTTVRVVDVITWEYSLRIDSKAKPSKEEIEQGVFSLIPALERRALREMQ